MLLIGGVVLAVVVCGLAALGIGAALGGPALLAMLGGATATTASVATDAPATATTAGGEAPTATAETAAETATAEVVVPPTDVPPTETTAPPTHTPEPTAIPVPEGMVLVPAGTFQMGAAAGDAQPIHSVTLAQFFLDQFEVTNARYRACEASGACTPPARRGSDTRGGYYTDTTFDQFPVLNVTWDQASTFCQSEGGRLPTEAEWEYAATGGDGRRYPWGNDFDRSLVPVSVADTQAVGSFPGGVSPFGVYDMAGNALEWVNDWYSDGYYAVSPPENPQGPDTGTRKVLRGGSFGNPDGTIYLATRRFSRPPNGADVDIGFRCMRPVQ
jgi:formylglycine-generating enzyme required for sulfatase activity